MAEFYRVVKTA